MAAPVFIIVKVFIAYIIFASTTSMMLFFQYQRQMVCHKVRCDWSILPKNRTAPYIFCAVQSECDALEMLFQSTRN